MNSRWFVHASLMASFTRRTLIVTTAPIFSSRSRIVLAQARASAGAGQPDAPQRVHQHVGGRGQPQAQLVGAEGGGRESIGK